MNKIILIFLFVLTCLLSSLLGFAQQTELELKEKNTFSSANRTEKAMMQETTVVISAELIKKSSDTLTFKITHPDLKNSLFNSQEKRDALFAMPGIIEISLFGDEPSFTVKMLGFYAENYLKTQFDSCHKENPGLFEMMKK